MSERVLLTDPLGRLQRWAMVCGLASAVVCGICASLWPATTVRAWLPAFLFAWGLSIGCLGLGLLYRVTGGRWGRAGAPFFEAGLRLVPATAVLFVPIAIGLNVIYPWTGEGFFTGHEHAAHRQAYLQTDLFLLRSAGYFVLWSVMSLAATRGWGGAGFSLMLLVFSVTFAIFDWVMSLDPWFASSILGALVGMGAHMAAMAFVCIGVTCFTHHEAHDKEKQRAARATLTDLGNLLLATVMLWTYMAFSQFLIIWSGNLSDEAAWYVRRSTGGWEGVAAMIAIAGFALPFTALLFRGLKRDPRRLPLVAIAVLATQYLMLCWQILPEFSPGRLTLNPMAFVTPLATGGLWLSACAWLLRRNAARGETARTGATEEGLT